MAKTPSPSDTANTAVRAYLYAVSKKNFPDHFVDPKKWEEIREGFSGCIYDKNCSCKKDNLAREHLDECNKKGRGLHIEMNVVPACGKHNREMSGKTFSEKESHIKRYGLSEKYQKHKKHYKIELPIGFDENIKKYVGQLAKEIKEITKSYIDKKLTKS